MGFLPHFVVKMAEIVILAYFEGNIWDKLTLKVVVITVVY